MDMDSIGIQLRGGIIAKNAMVLGASFSSGRPFRYFFLEFLRRETVLNEDKFLILLSSLGIEL